MRVFEDHSGWYKGPEVEHSSAGVLVRRNRQRSVDGKVGPRCLSSREMSAGKGAALGHFTMGLTRGAIQRGEKLDGRLAVSRQRGQTTELSGCLACLADKSERVSI